MKLNDKHKIILAWEFIIGSIIISAMNLLVTDVNEYPATTEIVASEVGGADEETLTEETETEAVEDDVEDTEGEVVLTSGTTDFGLPEGFLHLEVNGAYLPYQEQLFDALTRNGIGTEEWFQVALCEMYQESRFNPYAEAPNGLDKGLFQFRKTYWNYYSTEAGFGGSDIFDVTAQIETYAYLMGKRVREGKGIKQCVSDHYTGGVGYSEKYVNEVWQWIDKLEACGE